MGDNRCFVVGRVDHLDIVNRAASPRPRDCLAAEHIEPPASRSHGRVPDRHRQRARRLEALPIIRREHGRVRARTVVAAHDVCESTDRGDAGVISARGARQRFPQALPETIQRLPTVVGEPPPNTTSRPATAAPVPSWIPTRRCPINRSAPLVVSSENTPLADVDPLRPPSSTSVLPGPGTITSRLIGAASRQGNNPDSTAGGADAPRMGLRENPARPSRPGISGACDHRHQGSEQHHSDRCHGPSDMP